MKDIDEADFLGIRIGLLSRTQMSVIITEFALAGKRRFITYLNAHCVNVSFSDKEYRDILNKADLVYAGGWGVVWGARFLGAVLPERLNILDFFDTLSVLLLRNNISLYLLGGTEEVAQEAAEKLRYKGINVVGARSGFFTPPQEQAIIDEINHLRPHILMVGRGVPKQEKWIYNHLNELEVNLCWAVGAAFDWLSGQRSRAPAWMVGCGLEWLHRFLQQPRRLWNRYLIGNPLFCGRVCAWKIKSLLRL